MPFQSEMLHHCLSAEHVLVDEHKTCKITGFGFAEDVRDREDYERDEGVGASILTVNVFQSNLNSYVITKLSL